MDKKISELTVATQLAAADILPIVQSGANKKITAQNVFGKINIPVHINEAGVDQDTRISGLNDDNLVFVDASTDRVGFGRNTPAEKVDVNGGIRLNGISRNESIVTQTSTGPVNLTANTTVFAIGSPATATLANGHAGQCIELVCDSAGPIVVTGDNTAFASITLDAIGETASLKFVSGKWYIVGSFGSTIV